MEDYSITPGVPDIPTVGRVGENQHQNSEQKRRGGKKKKKAGGTVIVDKVSIQSVEGETNAPAHNPHSEEKPETGKGDRIDVRV